MINYFSKYKFFFYLCNFILIILYLFPGSILGWYLYNDVSLQPQITPDLIISSNHVYAFLILSFVGFFTFKKIEQLKFLSIYLIFLSIILEILHNFIPERSFQFTDLFGNLVGVIVVIIIFYFFKKNENFKN
ncbi:VanZ family protein [Candidatus Pelagibacter ubique]|uniref:VanZ family protein n=1 Tax=Pelagibacter ubique TaxID=198252 RepID=UPI0003C7DFF7